MATFKPYSIWAPHYEITSGGIRVLYALQSWLEVKGQVALMNTRFDIPFVGIYSEIVRGNPFHADQPVRYILQTPGMMAYYGQPSPTTEDFQQDPEYKDDLFIVFSKMYNTVGVDPDHILFCPVINLHLFRDRNKLRTKTCYLVGKGENQHKHGQDSIEITREFATDQGKLADLLNECHTMYCYDPISAMMDIARLCGCKVRYFGGRTQKELESYEPGIDGIDFGQGADLDPLEFRHHYEMMREEFSTKLDAFIEETQ